MTDEIIKPLRATKENFAKDAGFDIHRLVENIQREQAASAAQGRVFMQPPSGDTPSLEFQQIRFATSAGRPAFQHR